MIVSAIRPVVARRFNRESIERLLRALLGCIVLAMFNTPNAD